MNKTWNTTYNPTVFELEKDSRCPLFLRLHTKMKFYNENMKREQFAQSNDALIVSSMVIGTLLVIAINLIMQWTKTLKIGQDVTKEVMIGFFCFISAIFICNQFLLYLIPMAINQFRKIENKKSEKITTDALRYYADYFEKYKENKIINDLYLYLLSATIVSEQKVSDFHINLNLLFALQFLKNEIELLESKHENEIKRNQKVLQIALWIKKRILDAFMVYKTKIE